MVQNSFVTNQKYRYLVAFGSNKGDRAQNLKRALALLGVDVTVLEVSEWAHTVPLPHPQWGTKDHGEYINFVADCASFMAPGQFYKLLYDIEDQIGHDRSRKWLPRHLDLDILFCALNSHKSFVSCVPFLYQDPGGLCIPHPEFWNRVFLQRACADDLRMDIEKLREQHALIG